MIFTIPGPPFGKERPRFEGHAHTPAKTKAYEEVVAWAWKQARGRTLEGPVRIYITAYYAIPKSAGKKARAAMLAGEILPTKTPDADNVGKIIMDALNKRAYKDDAQVVTLCVMKRYAEEPRVVVEIEGETAEQREERIRTLAARRAQNEDEISFTMQDIHQVFSASPAYFSADEFEEMLRRGVEVGSEECRRLIDAILDVQKKNEGGIPK